MNFLQMISVGIAASVPSQFTQQVEQQGFLSYNLTASQGRRTRGCSLAHPRSCPNCPPEGPSISRSRRCERGKQYPLAGKKLRKQNQEGYAASLDKERKRKYLIKYRIRGSDNPPARVGDDISNPEGGVAGGPPALVGDVTQPPTGAPAVDLSTA